MRSSTIKRATVLQALALASLALALPLASQAATSKETRPGAPLVSTGGTSHASGTAAVLEGSVDPRTFATTYYFRYGPTVAYGAQTTPASLPAGTTKIRVSQIATGILLGYHYRLVASNADGTTEGHDRIVSAKKRRRKKTGLVLPKSFQPTALGGVFIISGTLTGTGNADRPIVLQASPYPYRAPLADIGAPILTNADGGFSFRVAHLTSNTRFRISTVSAPLISSRIVTEEVLVRVILKVRTSSQKRGLVRLYGTVTPAEVGARVFFQLEKAPKEERPEKDERPAKSEKAEQPEKSGKGSKSERAEERGPTFLTRFSTIVKRATRTMSRFSIVVNIADAGRYRAFVVVRPGPLSSGHSQSIMLQAAPRNGKRRNRSAKGRR